VCKTSPAVGDELLEIVGHDVLPRDFVATAPSLAQVAGERQRPSLGQGRAPFGDQDARFTLPQSLSADQMLRSSRKRSIGAEDLIELMR